jgi:hypothetical protein
MLTKREELSDGELDGVNGGNSIITEAVKTVVKIVVHLLNEAGVPIVVKT